MIDLQPARVVVSLATIPSRIESLAPVIDSMKAQTRRPDAMYVCICEHNEWEGRGYDVPPWLLADPFVQVVVAPKDYGPATKLLGVLPLERAPGTRIVTIDDDWRYESTQLERLELRFQAVERTAIGLSGARLPRQWSRIEVRIGPEIEASPPMPWRLTFLAELVDDKRVDILQFGFGAMMLRGWFEDDIFGLVESGRPWFLADDVLLSGYLESKGITRTCIAGMPLPRPLEQARRSPLSGDGRMSERYRAAIPALAAELDVWHPTTLASPFPKGASLADLRAWSTLAIRAALGLIRAATSTRNDFFRDPE